MQWLRDRTNLDSDLLLLGPNRTVESVIFYFRPYDYAETGFCMEGFSSCLIVFSLPSPGIYVSLDIALSPFMSL